jgi:hypothetical protein
MSRVFGTNQSSNCSKLILFAKYSARCSLICELLTMARNIIRVSPWHLRRLFRSGNFHARVQSGELAADLVRNNHLTLVQALKQEQLYCTHSQTLDYLDFQQITVATVHQYLSPDGISLGGSGEPDPKYLEINGVCYASWIKDTWYKKALYWGVGWAAGVRYKLLG